jgi:CDP-6-deoxy-D-xylo-4-hexulose-3-dehydrase
MSIKNSHPEIAHLNWPLMDNNITREDLDGLIKYLSQPDPMLTQSAQVQFFEKEWSEWLGVKYSVFVNSGASANLISMVALKALKGEGEVIVPTLTWVSDIASVLQAGLEPVFVDIDSRTLGMDCEEVLAKITPRTKAVFLTHILGYNALSRRLVDELKSRNIPLIEDTCESHGATFEGQKCGSIGWASNFSFYYAHHMSTIEGGMICTNDADLYETARMLRSHGMVREASSPEVRERWRENHPDLNPDFIFAYPAFNVRSTEINAVLGRSQLLRLDKNNLLRTRNLELFLGGLNPNRFQTDFAIKGSSNYAFTLVIKGADPVYRDRLETVLRAAKVEFRRGTSGGGNQLRQPYLRKLYPDLYTQFPKVDHVHFYGYYIGNYPGLTPERIQSLCELLNAV